MSVPSSKTPPPGTAKTAEEPARTLAQEKVDFTAEGSPPPGQVAGAAPLLPVEEALPPPPATPSKGAAIARPGRPSRG